MKIFSLLFIIAIFLQTTVIPLNLALILLISRSLVKSDVYNLYVSFIGGVLLGLLSSTNLAFYSLMFLLLSKLITLIKDLYFSSNVVLLLLLAGLIYLGVGYVEYLVLKQPLNFSKVVAESLLTIPFYLLARILEDKFSTRSDLRLKIK